MRIAALEKDHRRRTEPLYQAIRDIRAVAAALGKAP
jgi:hypothetical protein